MPQAAGGSGLQAAEPWPEGAGMAKHKVRGITVQLVSRGQLTCLALTSVQL